MLILADKQDAILIIHDQQNYVKQSILDAIVVVIQMSSENGDVRGHGAGARSQPEHKARTQLSLCV